jgi:RHS repeat-associated protein
VYDPGTLRRFVYDGAEAAAELDTSGAIQNRYVMGDGADEVLVDYAGSGTASRRFLSTDERGSVISLTDSSGALIGIDTYDEYGKPGAANQGRFQYTGQKWLSEIGAYDYKARVYLPHLGIFAQTDPVGPVDSPNLYGYVGDEPINRTDPLGLAWPDNLCPQIGEDIVCTAWGPGHDFGPGGGSLAGPGIGGGSNEPREGRPGHNGDQNPNRNNNQCPTGPRVNFSGGASGTGFLALIGASLGINLTVSLPTNPVTGAPSLRGTQVSVTGSATGLLGLGLFIGAGPTVGFSNSPAPTRIVSGSATPVFQLGGGAGEGVELSGALASDVDMSGAAGRLAIGGYAAVGERFTGTISTPPLGC